MLEYHSSVATLTSEGSSLETAVPRHFNFKKFTYFVWYRTEVVSRREKGFSYNTTFRSTKLCSRLPCEMANHNIVRVITTVSEISAVYTK